MKSFYKIFKISILTIASLSIFFACSLPRAVEKSHPDRPEWVYGIERDYIIVEGTGLSHQEAQNNAMKVLRERIVSSTAVNISSESQIEISEQIIENISRYSENTNLRTVVSSDFLNSLRGISLSKAHSFYWEKKKYPDKQLLVHYHIKYPFTKTEINKLIEEWSAMDKGFNAELEKLEKDIDNANSVYDLMVFKDKAVALKDIFSGVRKTRVSLLELRIEQLLQNLSLEAVNHDRGSIMLKLSSMGRDFIMESELQFSSTCASIFQSRLIGNGEYLNIVYDPDFCYGNDKSYFTISQNYGEYGLFREFEIPAPDDEIRFAVAEPVRFRALMSYYQQNTEWYIPIRVFTETAFIITKIEIVVTRSSKLSLRKLITGEDRQSFIHTNYNQTIPDKGDYILRFEVKEPLNSGFENLLGQFFNDSSSFTTSGKIFFRRAGEQKEYVLDYEGIKTIESR